MWEGGRLQCLIVSRGPTTYNALIQNHSDLNEHPFHSFFFSLSSSRDQKTKEKQVKGQWNFTVKIIIGVWVKREGQCTLGNHTPASVKFPEVWEDLGQLSVFPPNGHLNEFQVPQFVIRSLNNSRLQYLLGPFQL